MLKLAYEIIEEAFANKFDKGGNPYVFHPIRVCELVKEDTDDVDIHIIALFHDLFEDCPDWNAQKLRAFGFNERIIMGIDKLTRKPFQTYSEYIFNLMSDLDARMVKKADLKHNMDITRLSVLTKGDISRLKRYHDTFKKIVFFEENGYYP